MNCSTAFCAAPLPLPKSIEPLPLWRGFTSVLFALAFTFALSPTARAVDPPPDGGYPNDNTAEGSDALFSLTTGTDNTAMGFNALESNTSGYTNTATGSFALSSNTMGYFNTANGASALRANKTGHDNTANGFVALYINTGNFNTATGSSALQNNTTANDNTANGFQALLSNTTGSNNTANGANALRNNNADNNTANGTNALLSNTTGNDNAASGFGALQNNQSGNNNSANGTNSLFHNTNGDANTAVGFAALGNNKTGSNNIALGDNAGANVTGGSNNIYIGASGPSSESGHIRIGSPGPQNATFISGIYGALFANGVQVIASPTGRLGTIASSARFKEAVVPMDKTSEAILALHPVTFRYKPEFDPAGIPQFGLIAEEVAKINPDLIARDEKGEIYSVRYEAVNAMLLNEFLKEHCRMQEVEKDLRATIAKQQRQIEALSATVQKVSDQVALSKPAPQLVANP